MRLNLHTFTVSWYIFLFVVYKTGTITMKTKLAFLLLLILPTLCICCWAPPVFYGSECNAGPAIFGRPRHKVRYSISVNGNAGTLACCQGKGCGNQSARRCGAWEWQELGCSNSGTVSGTVLWGNNLATPKVRCYGVPFGATYSAST